MTEHFHEQATSCAQATQEDDDEEDIAGGVILAHSMGLGKSLQTIAFLHTFHSHWPDKRSLLLVPSNVTHNWVDEFVRWLPKDRPEGANELTPNKVCGDLLCVPLAAEVD